MTSSPRVVVMQKQLLAFQSVDRYRKMDTPNKELEYYVKNAVDYFSNPTKEPLTIDNFMQGNLYNGGVEANMMIGFDKKNNSPIWAKKKDLEKIKEQNLKYMQHSNLYQTVISFDNDWLNENITIEDLYKEMGKNILPKYFKRIGFDPSKISYQLSMHFDTNHLHFHLQFLEKEPAYKSRERKEFQYRRKAKIDSEINEYLKKSITLRVEMQKKFNPLMADIDKSIKDIKDQFKIKDKNFLLENCQSFRLEDKFLQLGKALDEYRKKNRMSPKAKIKFGSIKDKNIIKLTNELKKELIDKNKIINTDDFKKATDKFEEYIENLNKDFKVKSSEEDYKILHKKEEELENFILGQIVNNSLYEYRQIQYENYKSQKYESKEKYLLQELAWQNYKETKIKTKEHIMQYYIQKKNEYYKSQNMYSGFNGNSACYNLQNFNNKLKRIISQQEYEVQRYRERENINWYDKTRY